MSDRSKVLLIHPEEARHKYNFKGIIENECLDLEYLSAVLQEKGYSVFFWDGKIEDTKAADKIEEIKPDVVYITGRNFQEEFVLEYVETAKSFNENTIVIIGGLHAQLCFERMYKPYVDYILKSFDVFKVPVLIEHHNDLAVLEDTDDICFKKNGEWVSNKALPFDIKRLPRPDRTYFYEHPNNYNYLDLPHAAWVRSAYCCPYNCAFCLRNKMNCSRYSARDIEDVVDEIEEIKTENIYIVDDDFLFNEERLKTFIKLVKEKNIKRRFVCYGRSDFIASHEEIVKELSEIGFYYFLVGLETIRVDDMDKYHKRNSLVNNEKSIELCHKYNVHMMGMFILDLDFTGKEFRELYRYIKERKLKHVAVSIFTPEPGLESFESYKDRMITDNPGHFDYLHLVCKPDKLSVKAYYRKYYILLIKLFLKAYREKVYDFIDYKDYIKSFVKGFFGKKEA